MSPTNGIQQQPLSLILLGSNGMIGSHTVKYLLSRGHSILGLDLNPFPSDSEEQKTLDELLRNKKNIGKYSFRSCNCSVFEQVWKAVEEGGKEILGNSEGEGGNGKWDAVVNLVTVTRTDPYPPQPLVHNVNVTASYNALCLAGDLGINRIVQASSVNAIGLIFSKKPIIEYIPIDEKHPCNPEDAYSLSKQILEFQCDSFSRRYRDSRIASLRFHWVLPSRSHGLTLLSQANPPDPTVEPLWAERRRDLFGWTSLDGAAESVLLGITAPEATFPSGRHETFFIIGGNMIIDQDTEEVVEKWFKEIKEKKGEGMGKKKVFVGNEGLFDVSKAEKMLGWKEKK